MQSASPLVATIVERPDRPRLDAIAAGRFQAVHAGSVPDAVRAVRERPVQAVLVSPRCVERSHLPTVVSLIEGFPHVATVAVLYRHDPLSSERLLALGACGVRHVVDLSGQGGWRQLTNLLADPTTPAAAVVLARVIPALGEVPPDTRRFFEVLVRLAPTVSSVRTLSRRLGVRPSTLMSRFFRAAVPSPKRYLAAVRLVYAAGLMGSPGFSIADISYRLEFSSPQSFGRHLRLMLGVTAAEFRRRSSFDAALGDFIARLIVPYRSSFRSFHPLEPGVVDLGLGQCGQLTVAGRERSGA